MSQNQSIKPNYLKPYPNALKN